MEAPRDQARLIPPSHILLKHLALSHAVARTEALVLASSFPALFPQCAPSGPLRRPSTAPLPEDLGSWGPGDDLLLPQILHGISHDDLCFFKQGRPGPCGLVLV